MIHNRSHYTGGAPGVYVGRPTKWGNPFVIGRDGTREEVIAKFEAYLRRSPTLMAAAQRELKGKDLTCWCAPLPCHAQVLMLIANEGATNNAGA